MAHLSPRSLSFLNDEHRLIHIMVYLCLTLPWITSGDLDLLYMIPKNPGDPICGTLIRQRPLAILISALGRRSRHIPKRISRQLPPGGFVILFTNVVFYPPAAEFFILTSCCSMVPELSVMFIRPACRAAACGGRIFGEGIDWSCIINC